MIKRTLLAVLLAMLATHAGAAAIVWTDLAGDSNWYTPANWSPPVVPNNGDNVTIDFNGLVTVDASSPSISFASLQLGDPGGTFSPTLKISTSIASGGMLQVMKGSTLQQDSTQTLRVSDVTVFKGGFLTQSPNAMGSIPTAALSLDVSGIFTLQAGASAAVSGTGFQGGLSNGISGNGPGFGWASPASNGGGAGAGHGGMGGAAAGNAGGNTYDSSVTPQLAGSGGGGGAGATGGAGGNGGGHVAIRAGTMNLDGLVAAEGWNGGNGITLNSTIGAGGGGSGGTVRLFAVYFVGSGTITVRGGSGGTDTDDANDPGGGGGGGRIAISIEGSGSVGDLTIFANGGAGGGGGAVSGSVGSYAASTPYPGCSLTKNVGAGEPYSGISMAVSALPKTLSGHACVVIKDGATYPEQVIVEGFTNLGSSITIMADPSSGLRPTVIPSGGESSAFEIRNASVNISGMQVVTSAMPLDYGIRVSSPYVTIASMSVIDDYSRITMAGIALSSWTTVSHTSVTMPYTDAYGFWLQGSTKTSVSYSTAANNSATRSAVYLDGGRNNDFTVIVASNSHSTGNGLYALGSDTNTVTQSFLFGGGNGAMILTGSDYNEISLSTMVGQSSSGFYASDSDSNTVTQSHIWGSFYGVFLISGADFNAISLSTMIGPAQTALYIFASSSNTVTQSFMQSANRGANLNTGSDFTSIRLSTMIGSSNVGLFSQWCTSSSVTQSYMQGLMSGASFTGGVTGAAVSFSTMIGGTDYGFYSSGSSSNSVTQSFIWGGSTGAYLDTGSDYNAISFSTMIGNGEGGLFAQGADSNTITQSYMWGAKNGAFFDVGSTSNTISVSTMVGSSLNGLYFNTSASNTATQSFMRGGFDGAFLNISDYNTISFSTMIGSGNHGLHLTGASSNTLTQNYAWGSVRGAALDGGANENNISLSAMIGNTNAGFYINACASNTMTQSFAQGSTYGALLFIGADHNTISLSTVISNHVSNPALYVFRNSSNTIQNSYIQGSTAAAVSGSTGTVIDSSELFATGTAGSALALQGGSVSLTVASTTLRGGSSGRGLLLDAGNSGAVLIGSVTVAGSGRGLEISAQEAGFTLAIDSITFRGLAAGATAIHFLGGTHASTITLANFEDTTIDTNVNAAAVDLSSRILMRAHYGVRTSSAYENDPGSVVSWQAGPYPGCAETSNVGLGQDYASIQAAIDALPSTLSGHSCVVIRDGATYLEQVTVEGFTNLGSSITIMADPASGVRPLVRPSFGVAGGAFEIRNASVNISGIELAPIMAMAYGIKVSSPYVTITSVSINDQPSVIINQAGILASSWTTVSYTSVTVGNVYGILLQGGIGATVSYSTAANNSWNWTSIALNGASSCTLTNVVANNQQSAGAVRIDNGTHNHVIASSFTAPSGFAFYLYNSSFNTIGGSYMSVSGGDSAKLENAAFNTIDQSTFASNSGGGSAALSLVSASSNEISGIFASNPNAWSLHLAAGSNNNTISQSTMSSYLAGDALHLTASSSNTVTKSYIQGGNRGAFFEIGSSTNTISFSTVIAVNVGLYADASSSNTVTQSFLRSGMHGVMLYNGSNSNRISFSTMTGGTDYGFYTFGASSNSVTQSYMQGGQSGAHLASVSQNNDVTLSTMTGLNYGLMVGNSSATLVADSYIHGSTGVYAFSSFQTLSLTTNRLVGGVLPADGGSPGCAALATSGGDFSMRGNQVSSAGDGVCLDSGNDGLLEVSSNTITSSANVIRVLSQVAGTQIWISSNTILPVPGSMNGNALYFESLTSGATVWANDIYYRTSGGAAAYAYDAVRVKGSQNVIIRRNRINMPHMIMGGDISAFAFDGSSNNSLFSNDVNLITVGVAATASLVRVTNISSNIVMKSNIYSSSMTVSGSSVAVFVDASSAGGLQSNYNLYFSSNGAPGFSYNGVSLSGLAAFTAQSGQDANSATGNPHWVNTGAGLEDFHVKSTAGRCADAPTCSSFTLDSVDSASLDRGDPADSYADEPAPNGYLANAGTTGGTKEASKSPAGVCAVLREVCKSGCPYSFIQAAVDSLPNPLVGYSCVHIKDASTYDELVRVDGFTLNGSSIVIRLDPTLSVHPKLMTSVSGTSALEIRTASTTIIGLDVSPNNTVQYGILASSPNVTLSSVNVIDIASMITSTAVVLVDESSLSYATITVQNANATALSLQGSFLSVSYTSAAYVGGIGGGFPVLSVSGASNLDLHDLFVRSQGTSNEPAWFDTVTNATVLNSTFSAASASISVRVKASSSFLLDRSVIDNGVAAGRALFIDAFSSDVTVDHSSITASPAGGVQVVVMNGSNNALQNTSVNANDGIGVEVGGTSNRLSTVTVNASGSYAAVSLNGTTNSLVTGSRLYSAGGPALVIQGGGAYGHNAVTFTTMTSASNTLGDSAVRIVDSSTNSIVSSYIHGSNAGSWYGLLLTNTSSNTIVMSTIAVSASQTALSFDNASRNEFDRVRVIGGSGQGVMFANGASDNTVSRSTITTASSASSALSISASSNTVRQSLIVNTAGTAAQIDASGSGSSLLQSSFSAAGAASYGVYLNGTSSNTVEDCYIHSPSGNALMIYNYGSWNTVERSTIVSGASAYAALEINMSSVNYIGRSVILSTGGYYGAYLQSAANENILEDDFLSTSGGNSNAVRAVGVSRNAFRGLVAAADGHAMSLETGADNVVERSTFTGGAGMAGLYINTSNNAVVSGSYIQGSTAVFILGGNPVLHMNRLVASGGSGVSLGGTSAFSMSSNTVSGGLAGVYIDPYSTVSGPVVISTNSFLPTAQSAISAGELVLGASLWITSNTIQPSLSASTHTYGIYIKGLSRGATIQNNAIVYRTAGSMGANTTYGVYLENAPGVKIDHNRYFKDGRVTGGGAAAIGLFGSGAASVLYNDIYSSGTANTAPYLVQLVDSPNVAVRNNVFGNAITASISQSVCVYVGDGVSQTGFSSDYNDFFLQSNARAGRWSGPNLTFSGWQTTAFQDAQSLSADPLWFSTGTEDFHVRSGATSGRWDPAGQIFVSDTVSSPTIDGADPLDSPGAELAPGDSRANMGSYGQTAEASRAAPPAGCSRELSVPSGSYGDVQTAINSLGSSLSDDPCIVIRSLSMTDGDFTVSGIAMNDHRLTIMGDPALTPPVLIDPGSFTNGFLIQNDSVTIKNLDILPTAALSYGINATGADVRITSVTFDDTASGTPATGAFYVSSGAVVSFSSVTAGGAALTLIGSGASISYSTFAAKASGSAIKFIAASSGTLSHVVAISAGSGVSLDGGTHGMSVADSTFTTSGASPALSLLDAYDNTVGGSVLASASTPLPALYLFGASSNTVTRTSIQNTNSANSVMLTNGAHHNTLSQSRINGFTSSPAVFFDGSSSSNTLTGLFVVNTGGDGISITDDSHDNAVDQSTVTVWSGAVAVGLNVWRSSSTRISRNYLYSSATFFGYALSVNNANFTSVDRSTITASHDAFHLTASSKTSLTLSMLRAGSVPIYLDHSTATAVDQSTAVALGANPAVYVWGGIGNTVSGSYLEGAEPMRIDGASATVVNSNTLYSKMSTKSAALVMNGSVHLSFSSNTMVGGTSAAGLDLDPYNSGRIVITTNSFPAGAQMAQYAIRVGTQSPGTVVWIASNTISPAISNASLTYGLYLNGLTSGATIHDNSVYYRTSGAASPFGSYAFYAQSCEGLVVDHNRFSNPGMMTDGTYVGIVLSGAPRTTFKFNDVNSAVAAGGSLSSAYALAVEVSTGLHVYNNVFSSSLTVSGSSATFFVDAFSGTDSDFNLFFSSTARNTMIDNGVDREFPWGNGIDMNSAAFNPHWKSVAPGAEDFHPLSQGGRFDPASQTFVADGWTAGSLDRADMNDQSFSLEPAPDGGRPNLGSYGGTVEASKSPAEPTSPQFAQVYATSATVTFGAVGALAYNVVASTMSDFSGTLHSSATLAGQTTLSPQGLSANTTYFFLTAAIWGDAAIFSPTLLTTATLAEIPSPGGLPTVFLEVHVTSASVSWFSNGNTVGQTTYTVVMSSGLSYPNQHGANVEFSTTPPGTYPTATFSSLAPNTTYQLFAAAENIAGVFTPYALLGTSVTLPAEPLTAGTTYLAVTTSTLSLAWDANGNPLSFTTYAIVASTASDFNAWASSVTMSTAPAAGPTATLYGLSPATTYYLQLQAIGHQGLATQFVMLGSTMTPPVTLLAPALESVSASSYSLTAVWSLTADATGYTLEVSTLPDNPSVTVWAASSTFAQAATTATVFAPALDPNTTYYLFVRANGDGSSGPYAAFPATATLPALPLTAISTYSDVASSSFTVSWLSGGNPLAMTTYTLVASTASDFNTWASSVVFSTTPAAGPSVSLAGLTPDTIYFLQVRALGQGVSVTPFVDLGSTRTVAIDLPAPSPVGVTGVSAGSATASWSLLSGATGYTLVASYSTNNPPVGIVASSVVADGSTLSASVFGLAANTTHYLFVRGDGPGASGPYAIFTATATDPVFPTAVSPAFPGVWVTSAAVSWQQGSNPVGVTTYTVTLSTTAVLPNSSAGNVTYSTCPSAASLTFDFAPGDLAVNTTYFAFVSALSHGGSSFGTVLGSTSTGVNAPTAAALPIAMVGVSSVTFNWQANGNPSITTYTIVASTASDFNAWASSVVFSTIPSAGLTATMPGLAFGTTYYFQVRAINHNAVASDFLALGSTLTVMSNTIPQIVDAQGGDDAWRRTNNGLYDVRFNDASSMHLDRVMVKVSTTAGGAGTDLIAFTNAVTGLNPLDSYSTPWLLPASVFNAMLEGATNYVTVRVYNNVPSTATLQDAFYVRKDTTAPTIGNGEAGGDAVVQSVAGRLYAVTVLDRVSGLAGFEYSASLAPGGGASLIPWTPITVLSGATDYTTAWPVDFNTLLSGVTNYISVRAWDVAGTTSTLVDAFKVLKDTTGPNVALTAPTDSSFVSSLPSIGGTAASPFGIKGTEVSVQEVSSGFFWDPSGPSFSAALPMWMPATGTTTWTFASSIPLADGETYRAIARSSTTFDAYSATYATATFVVDTATPTVAVQAPVPDSTVSVLPVISGTALDPGGSPAGLSSVEVRLRRNADGLWWNWFTESWGVTAISTVAAGTAGWQVAPTPLLLAGLSNAASYYIAVRASDNAQPSNQGGFFVAGATFTWQDTTPPSAIADFAAVRGSQPGYIDLAWTAPGDDGASGTILIGQYRIFYSTDVAAVASTSTAQIVFSTAMLSPGAPQSYTLTGLNAGATYFLKVALDDGDGNWSAFSNQASTSAAPAPFNAIAGHVVNLSSQGITAVQVDAWDAGGAPAGTTFTLADGSGTFLATGLTAGSYKLKVTWTVNGISSSLWQDGISMGSSGVDFTLEIDYSLATLTGTLSTLTTSSLGRTGGLSVSALGSATANAASRVELFQGGRQVGQVGVKPNGRWTIPNLLPGRYAVRAYTGSGYTDMQDVELLEGEVRTLGFVFNPLPEEAVFAFPNPARTATTIRFMTDLAPLEADINIFDLAGNLVREFPGSAIVAMPGSRYHVVWDLNNSRGQAVASGVYLVMVKIKGGSDSQTAKVIKKVAVVR